MDYWCFSTASVSRLTAVRRPGIVLNVDLPHLGPSAHMHRARRAGNPALAYGTQVIGIYFHAHAVEPIHVDAQGGGHATKRLGKHDACPSMQQAQWLRGPVVNRHGAAQIVFPYLREPNVQMLKHGAASPGVKVLCGQALLPDRFHVERWKKDARVAL